MTKGMCITLVNGEPCKRGGREWDGNGGGLMCPMHWRLAVRLQSDNGFCESIGCPNDAEGFGDGWYLCQAHRVSFSPASWERIQSRESARQARDNQLAERAAVAYEDGNDGLGRAIVAARRTLADLEARLPRTP